jgi:hypothetical protein
MNVEIFIQILLNWRPGFSRRKAFPAGCRGPGRHPTGSNPDSWSLHIHRSYAIIDLAGACRDNQPDSPPAGWKIPLLLHKKFARCANFLCKSK